MWFGVLLAFLMLFPVRVLAQTGSPARMIPRTSMTIQVVSEETDTSPAYLKGNAIDGNPSNFWHTNFTPSATSCATAPYCWAILNLGATYNTNKLIYWPALSNLAGGSPQNNGRVADYHIYVATTDPCPAASAAGWTEVATGSWQDNIDTKRAAWTATPARCVKLESRANANGSTIHMHAAEIAVFEEATFPPETPTAAANADFIARCTAPGVTVCYSFDQAPTGASLNHMPNQAGEDVGVNLTLAADGQLRITRDTTYKVSGAGSLVFTAPPPPHGGPNIAGNLELNPFANRSIAGVGNDFGPNEDMYVQFWRRQTNETQFNTWREAPPSLNGAGMKYFTFYRYSTPCAPLNLVLFTYYITDMIMGYSNCGQVSWATIPNTATWKTTTSPFWQQGGDVGCQYASWKNCYFDEPDVWTNYYCKFHIGSLPPITAPTVFDSTVECWQMRQGEASYKKFIDITDGYFLHGNGATGGAGFDSLELLMYMTDVDNTSGDPGVTSKVYFDELIVSSQPIAQPGMSAGTSAVSGGGLGSGGGRF